MTYDTKTPKVEISADIIVKELELNGSIKFSNKIITGAFETDLSLKDLTKVEFAHCEFNSYFNIRIINTKALEISLHNCKFNKGIEIKSESASITISSCKIRHGIKVISENKIELNIYNITISDTIDLSDLKLGKSKFQSVTCIEGATTFSLKKTVFLETINFLDSKLLNSNFSGCEFLGEVQFKNILFDSSKAFPPRNFEKIIFHNKVTFIDISFINSVSFENSVFKNYSFFTRLNNNIDITKASFKEATFEKKVYFYKSNFTELSFAECRFEDFVSFKELQAGNLDVGNAYFLNGAHFLNSNISGDRETYRTIKSEFLKINNHVEAAYYKSKELTAYEKELGNSSYSELILLFFNRISNQHGLRWDRSVLFTILIAIVFFILYLLSLTKTPMHWGWADSGSFYAESQITLQYFIRFFIITHDLDFMKDYQPTALSFVIDFFGKVFIGYGIYQTIQAFRKYGKTESK